MVAGRLEAPVAEETVMPDETIATLLAEYDRALDWTGSLVEGLDDDELHWRPHEDASAIAWHLGHQGAVAHFLVRNLTAAAPRLDPALELVMDSATPERQRGDLPATGRILAFRQEVVGQLRDTIGRIGDGEVGAPAQLAIVARGVMTAIVNHEYQHSQWIGEVRRDDLGRDVPAHPTSPLLRTVDGYCVLDPTSLPAV